MIVHKSVLIDQNVVGQVEAFGEVEGHTFVKGGTNFSRALNEAARRGTRGMKEFDTADLLAEIRRRTGCERIGFEWGGLRD